MIIATKIKRGTRFRIAVVMNEGEWAMLSPWQEITAEVNLPSGRRPLEVAVSEDDRTIMLTSSTADWPLGHGAFDLRIVKDGEIIAIPSARNIPFQMIEGATR